MSAAPLAATAPYADMALPAPEVEAAPLDGGGWLLRSPVALEPYPDHIVACLRRWAAQAPERVFLAERRADGSWRRIGYAAAASASAGIAQALIDASHSPARPIAILSDNGIDFALLMLGAMHVGIPVLPVSPAYSLMSRDFAKLRAVIAHHDPSLIFVDDPAPFEAALAALKPLEARVLTSRGQGGGPSLAAWAAVAATGEVERRLAGVGPDTVAKILLTSGSTGTSKGVVNTQRMLCANQAMTAQAWPFLRARPPVVVDWLPWSHTFGGNFDFNLVLYHGGTFVIDDGRPVAGRFDRTLANLRAHSPTIYLNVPRGYDMLIPALEADEALRDALFRDLDLLFFAGAALPHNLRRRLEALSVAALGARLPISTSLGATETGPAATCMTWDSDVWGNIGVPLPGCEMKLVPNGDKFEARFKGPHVTPGYYREPDLTASMFDADGFFGIGDAARFLDPQDPAKGLLFDGRVAENFKLTTGTWVHAGTLRLAAIEAAAPAVQDAVVTGRDRREVGLLAFPSPAGCRSLCPDAPEDEPIDALIRRPEVRRCVADGLARHNRAQPGSSTAIRRALLTPDPPAIDANEITDKGYINQRAVIERRADLIERIHADPPDPDVLPIPREG